MAIRRTLSVDVETFSSVDLAKAGVHAYTESEDFEILLIGYAFDDEPVQVWDCTEPGCWPREVLDALTDDTVTKYAWNAAFERACFEAELEEEMPADQWVDTMVMALELGLPGSLAAAGAALNLAEEEQKDAKGKILINYFSKPCKPTKTNGGRTRNLPSHDKDKWKLYIEYNRQDVVTERTIRQRLEEIAPLNKSEQALWWLDQKINDTGIRVDVPMVEKIVEFDALYREELQNEAKELTGLENPNSLTQLKGWLQEQGVDVSTLRKDDVEGLLGAEIPDDVRRVLEIRQALGKTSTAKYSTMLEAACEDDRVRGMLQFYGASRSGRWAGRLVQVHNLARNSLPDLDLARQITADGDFEALETLFGEPAFIFSELVRTAFIPSEGHRFVVSDFSAIEARVISWLAGEEWRLKAFREGKDIYCETASQMYHVPVEKHGQNAELRGRGKVAELACGFQGGVGAMKQMDKSGTIPEDEQQAVVDQWRAANPRIVRLWRDYEQAAKTAIKERRTVRRGVREQISYKDLETRRAAAGGPVRPYSVRSVAVEFSFEGGNLFVRLPSGRRLCYWGAKIREKDGREQIVYQGTNQTTKQWGLIETYGGKLVENCLAADTVVLTSNGWKTIETVKRFDLLWDGETWVTHGGVIRKEPQETISVDGVRMTADHKVMTKEGWRSASSCEGLNRADVRLPDRRKVHRVRRKEEPVDGSLPVRENDNNAGGGVCKGDAEVMRLHARKAHIGEDKEARDVGGAYLERLALHEAAVRKSEGASVEELRRARDNGLPGVVGELRGVSQGHGADLSGGADARPDRCEQGLLPGELSMGADERAGKEQKEQPKDHNAVGADDGRGSLGALRDKEDNAALQTESRSAGVFTLSAGRRSEPVFDIKNAGARHRFTVLSDAGPMLVHNCVQAIARDCLAVAMGRINWMGYEIVMHVHDEVICDVPEMRTDAAERITAAMSEPIDWAPGLPLKGETYEAAYYMKD